MLPLLYSQNTLDRNSTHMYKDQIDEGKLYMVPLPRLVHIRIGNNKQPEIHLDRSLSMNKKNLDKLTHNH